jgi:hypothetical protein
MIICLHCGCSMVGEKEANCPVCGHLVKKEPISYASFGEKSDENSNPKTTDNGDSTTNI